MAASRSISLNFTCRYVLSNVLSNVIQEIFVFTQTKNMQTFVFTDVLQTQPYSLGLSLHMGLCKQKLSTLHLKQMV